MLKERLACRRLLAVLLSSAMILSCASFLAFAEEGAVSVGTLELGTKQSITFDSPDSKFYKVTIPKKGLYRIDYYSSYHNNYNDDFWVGIYESQSDAENTENLVQTNFGLRNYDNSKQDYEIYSLEAKTYYLHVQAHDETKASNFGLRIKAATDDDLYELYIDDSRYAGMKDVYVSVGYYDPVKDKSYDGKLTSVVSSNKKVVKVVGHTYYDENNKKSKYYTLSFLKKGKATVTVKYKRANGTKATIKETISVKNYPNMIKSLKVNGKTVKISKNKLKYTVNKFKKTSAKIKMATKNGWKVTEATVDLYGKTYKYKELNKSVITNGKAISIPKKYDYAIIYIYMENKSGDHITYEVDLIR